MDDHWLVRATTIRRLWIAFIVVLLATVLDGTFGFGAWFGFASCVVLIVFAKGLGALLKRPDTYYDD